jgi:hypothetical protein
MAANASASGPVAPPQAGVLEGSNPIAYTPSNPISLFIVQASTYIPAALQPLGSSCRMLPLRTSGRIPSVRCCFTAQTDRWPVSPGPGPGRAGFRVRGPTR